jgi:hypothetical protein
VVVETDNMLSIFSPHKSALEMVAKKLKIGNTEMWRRFKNRVL